MITELERQWREEFESNNEYRIDNNLTDWAWKGYLSARKKAKEEIDALGGIKKYPTALGYISELREEIKKRDELIGEAMPYLEYLSEGRLYSNHLVDVWIDKAKKMVGGNEP